jgi:hypothetical protein
LVPILHLSKLKAAARDLGRGAGIVMPQNRMPRGRNRRRASVEMARSGKEIAMRLLGSANSYLANTARIAKST